MPRVRRIGIGDCVMLGRRRDCKKWREKLVGDKRRDGREWWKKEEKGVSW